MYHGYIVVILFPLKQRICFVSVNPEPAEFLKWNNLPAFTGGKG